MREGGGAPCVQGEVHRGPEGRISHFRRVIIHDHERLSMIFQSRFFSRDVTPFAYKYILLNVRSEP